MEFGVVGGRGSLVCSRFRCGSRVLSVSARGVSTLATALLLRESLAPVGGGVERGAGFCVLGDVVGRRGRRWTIVFQLRSDGRNGENERIPTANAVLELHA